ncbi:hypothetical protein GQ53DRAFT_832642 [Thozetella sp. PMI_491]|nr:hypothetical protein GQ53DRAFT_832642 [Thozetella sp. PMI_491]
MNFDSFERKEPIQFSSHGHGARDKLPGRVGDPSYKPNGPFGLPGGLEIRLDKLVEPDLPPRLKSMQTIPHAAKVNPCVLIAKQIQLPVGQVNCLGTTTYTPGLPISDFTCPLCTHTHYFVEPPAEPEPTLEKIVEDSGISLESEGIESEEEDEEDDNVEDDDEEDEEDDEYADDEEEDDEEDDDEEEESADSMGESEEISMPAETCASCNSVTMKFVSSSSMPLIINC